MGQRTMIVTEVLDTLRAKGNGFVRLNDEGEWVQCADVMCREKIGQHFRNALGDLYKSKTGTKRRRSKEQPTTCSVLPTDLIYRLRRIVFSSKATTRIVERFTFDVIFIEGDSCVADKAFHEKAFASNASLLRALKEDAALVQQFQSQFALGQQRQQQQQELQRSGSRNSMNALAA